ncbi:MAG: glycosyltransferase family 9 protein [Candidatus Omnitrophica bacterium]|nr:glycosyltransferase family 9 protein [Candidatus Omnitrophota bacterium]
MKKILIVNPFGVGDVLFSTPVIAALKKEFPDSFIAYLCNSQVEQVLQNHPAINLLLFFSRGDFKALRKQSLLKYFMALIKAINQLRNLSFDFVVDVSMVTQYSFILRLIGVKKIYGFDYKGRGNFLTDKVPFNGFENKHVVEYYGDLLKKIGIKHFEKKLEFYLNENDIAWAERFLEKHIEKDAGLLVGISAFGGKSWGDEAVNKQWPLARFAGLIKEIIKRYNAVVLLLGAKDDQYKAQEICEIVKDEKLVNAAGKTSMGELGALIKKCKLYIGNDSGPLHIACALGVKTVSIFGPVDEKVYGPVGTPENNRVVCADLSCRPCYKNFTKQKCEKFNCLLEINEKDVLKSIEGVICKLTL